MSDIYNQRNDDEHQFLKDKINELEKKLEEHIGRAFALLSEDEIVDLEIYDKRIKKLEKTVELLHLGLISEEKDFKFHREEGIKFGQNINKELSELKNVKNCQLWGVCENQWVKIKELKGLIDKHRKYHAIDKLGGDKSVASVSNIEEHNGDETSIQTESQPPSKKRWYFKTPRDEGFLDEPFEFAGHTINPSEQDLEETCPKCEFRYLEHVHTGREWICPKQEEEVAEPLAGSVSEQIINEFNKINTTGHILVLEAEFRQMISYLKDLCCTNDYISPESKVEVLKETREWEKKYLPEEK